MHAVWKSSLGAVLLLLGSCQSNLPDFEGLDASPAGADAVVGVSYEIDLSAINIYLQESFAAAERDSDLGRLGTIVDTYHLLGWSIPDPSRVQEIFDAMQRSDGTWSLAPGFEKHYAVITMVYSMMYHRLGLSPQNSLADYFDRIDTWDELQADIKSFEAPKNYWGGAIGYVMLYVAQTGIEPPWMQKLYDQAKANTPDWIEGSHQRARAVQLIACTGRSLPQMASLLNAILSQQNEADGGWGNERVPESNVDDSASNVILLARYFGTDPKAASAIKNGLDYIHSNYRTDSNIAGFSESMGNQEIESHMTFMALAAFVETGYVPGTTTIMHPVGKNWW
jgi:hypothetical protein